MARLPEGRVAIAGRHPRRWRTEVWVFEVDGALRKRWALEGHATCLQTDAVGDLWLAFVHDADVPEPEHPHDPAVQPAVARWSADGTLLGLASVAPHAGSNALNVAPDGVWSCADGGAFFRLPVAGGIDRWDAGVHHVRAIAASADAALLVWDLEPLRAHLVHLRPGGVIGVGHVVVVDHDGVEIDAEHAAGRGSRLHIASAGRWLVLDLDALL